MCSSADPRVIKRRRMGDEGQIKQIKKTHTKFQSRKPNRRRDNWKDEGADGRIASNVS
jgi:hypothetical protein